MVGVLVLMIRRVKELLLLADLDACFVKALFLNTFSSSLGGDSGQESAEALPVQVQVIWQEASDAPSEVQKQLSGVVGAERAVLGAGKEISSGVTAAARSPAPDSKKVLEAFETFKAIRAEQAWLTTGGMSVPSADLVRLHLPDNLRGTTAPVIGGCVTLGESKTNVSAGAKSLRRLQALACAGRRMAKKFHSPDLQPPSVGADEAWLQRQRCALTGDTEKSYQADHRIPCSQPGSRSQEQRPRPSAKFAAEVQSMARWDGAHMVSEGAFLELFVPATPEDFMRAFRRAWLFVTEKQDGSWLFGDGELEGEVHLPLGRLPLRPSSAPAATGGALVDPCAEPGPEEALQDAQLLHSAPVQVPDDSEDISDQCGAVLQAEDQSPGSQSDTGPPDEEGFEEGRRHNLNCAEPSSQMLFRKTLVALDDMPEVDEEAMGSPVAPKIESAAEEVEEDSVLSLELDESYTMPEEDLCLVDEDMRRFVLLRPYYATQLMLAFASHWLPYRLLLLAALGPGRAQASGSCGNVAASYSSSLLQTGAAAEELQRVHARHRSTLQAALSLTDWVSLVLLVSIIAFVIYLLWNSSRAPPEPRKDALGSQVMREEHSGYSRRGEVEEDYENPEATPACGYPGFALRRPSFRLLWLVCLHASCLTEY
ncbi:hypothetical protein AK812_SmicGene10056 [Symbiodinium microadriaticum]|uniref:Uncharacterized protein n=1 Tax=Symbiodinium microadriaticum TaxID=2951 RepID=A0A1Q9EGZ9_SYMMI|nr:hypothetical protein AK812_SmicGene10056 [Symbiodinium microadriaticum]